MHYDIAAKVLMEKCREEILRQLLGLSVTESTLLEELPQETVSVRRSDFAILVTDEEGLRRLVLLEVQSRWEHTLPLRLLDYRTRYLIKYQVKAVSFVLLLRHSDNATATYWDNEVRFDYRLIRIYEMDAEQIVEKEITCLLPFVPLMRNGEEWIDKADMLLYESRLPRQDKADMLTVMTIFSGLVSARLPQLLIAKRRDIMVESAAYDLIKQEGKQEGLQQGLQQGLRQGILDNLEVRFGRAPQSIIVTLDSVKEVGVLRTLHRRSSTVASLEEFDQILSEQLTASD